MAQEKGAHNNALMIELNTIAVEMKSAFLVVETKSCNQVRCNPGVSMGAFDVCGGKINYFFWVRGMRVINMSGIFCSASAKHDRRFQLQGLIVIHDNIVRLEFR